MARRPPAPRRPGPGGAHLRAPATARKDAPAPREDPAGETTREETAAPVPHEEPDRTRAGGRDAQRGRAGSSGGSASRRGRSRTGRRPVARNDDATSSERSASKRSGSGPAASSPSTSEAGGHTAQDKRGGVLVPAADRFRDLMRPRPWRRRRRAIIVTAILLVLALVAAVLTLLYAPYFKVQQVSVRGTSYVDAKAVEAAVAGGEGTSILTLPTGDLARSAASVPGVRTAEVSRAWPHGVRVTVVEREPLATVTEPGGATVIVDAEGVPLPDAAAKDRHLVPLQVGEGTVDEAGATHAMLAVLAALPDDLRGRVTAITATTPTDVTLAVRTDGHGDKTLVWGDAKDSDLKGQVTAALLETPGTVIDVSSPVAPVTR